MNGEGGHDLKFLRVLKIGESMREYHHQCKYEIISSDSAHFARTSKSLSSDVNANTAAYSAGVMPTMTLKGVRYRSVIMTKQPTIVFD
jgi:hypothetical protein